MATKFTTPDSPESHCSTNLSGWLRLTTTPGLGSRGQRKLLSHFGLPEKIFSAGQTAIAQIIGEKLAHGLFSHDITQIEAVTQTWCSLSGQHLITLADADYPKKLLELSDPPSVLYAKGRRELLNHPALAVVGARSATPQGKANAFAFSQGLCTAGLTIVSGMALGIDTSAHEGALACSAPASTIAVLGTGIDRIYPAANAALARKIAVQGLLISEFPLGTPAQAYNFPKRNRLIAGLAEGVLVVEAAASSGSLITARLAAETGREVFAIPGSIHAPLSKGCHALIKQGAKLVESSEDVLSELPIFIRQKEVTRPSLTSSSSIPIQSDLPRAQHQILEALGHDPATLDQLAQRTNLPIETLSPLLLDLELSGLLGSLPGQRFQRLF